MVLSILNLMKGQISNFQLPQIDSQLIFDKFLELQNTISALSIQEGPIAPAHVILLAAGVVIFLGVAGEAFFKKNRNSRCCVFDDLGSYYWASIWSYST